MSSQNWQSVKLSEITSKIGSGATPRGGKESYKDSGITLIRSLNVYDFYFDYDGLAFIDEKQAKELDNVEVKPKDILLNITGASVARCCIVPEKLLPARVNQHVSIIRTKPEIANPHFVFYTINSPFYKSHLLTLAQGGATREALTKETIEKFEIPLPPLPIQRRIADILSAYDDLIENNTRRIRILEGMAQAIYQEWFGKVDKESLPEGWEIKELQNVDASIIDGDRGKNYPSKNEFSKDGYCLFLNAGNFKNDRFDYSDTDFVTEEKDNVLRKGRLQPNDIVLTTRGTVGKIAFFSEKAPFKNLRINSGMVIVRPTANSLYWYFLLKSPLLKEQYKSFASGSAQPQLPIEDLNQINVLVPPEKIISQFCEIVKPIAEQIEILLRKNTNLRQTRDLLLPRLVSGEISVNGL